MCKVVARGRHEVAAIAEMWSCGLRLRVDPISNWIRIPYQPIPAEHNVIINMGFTNAVDVTYVQLPLYG